MIKIIVTLIKNDYISSITLPEKISGKFWIKDTDRNGNIYNLISIEAINNEWILKSNDIVNILDPQNLEIKSVILKPLNIYYLKMYVDGRKICIFTEPITFDRQQFKKISIKGNKNISIGRAENNDFVNTNNFVSANHAKLSFYNGQWSIKDLDSTNGTFVNGYRISDVILIPGDCIYIMGFKIIIGHYFITFNNPDGKISYNEKIFSPFIMQEVEIPNEDEEVKQVPVNYFYRLPRFKRDIEKAIFKIDSPPQSAIGEQAPMILLIGPSVTMGMASLTMAIFTINNAMQSGRISQAIPSMVMSFSMLLGTMLWPILYRRYEKKRRLKKEKLRQESYREYLKKLSLKFYEECKNQESILRENYISISECINRIQTKKNLWERGPMQNDFLKLRTGIGNSILFSEISYQERRFSLEKDNLKEELYNICESPKILKDIPITLSLFDDYIVGIIGERNITKEFSKGLILQIASLYSYNEVKMVFIFDEDEEKEFGFTKWLPHVWSGDDKARFNDNKVRFVATDNDGVKEISAFMEKEIEERTELNDDNMRDVSPYYVIFALSRKLSLRSEMLKMLYSKKRNMNMSIITFYDEFKNLPKECITVVDIKKDAGKIFKRNDITGKYTSFVPDIFMKEDTTKLSIQLANVLLDTASGLNKLPSVVTFLEMYSVGKVEHLNILTRWKDNDPTQSLEASVGIDTLGDIFKLDLHEKFHGPHGLVAGMTGSGKSEFIMSYILSLAINYHPNEVSFILIDYKGGGMAKSFENLPHTAGIITNLDGAAVNRSLISIQSELKRRQAIFGEASKKIEVSNIDIYKYQRLYRDGIVSEPMQHLFIISDEFAELKMQQPEFMAQLISAARIGRSLGVHLILATQKPAGIVNDQIWSNSKFRICLKVQERADSMDMLKRPDAAELTNAGKFYLQVGFNELFQLGQSAWAGAPYIPSDKVVEQKYDKVTVIDRSGRIMREAKTDGKKGNDKDSKKQMDVITDYLCKIAEEENISIHKLWLEPIPGHIRIDKLIEKYHVAKENKFELNPVIGEYDDPAKQRQCILQLPISKEGNTIVYGVTGSGKSTFLATMIYSLIQNHTPDEVNIYILEFAAETLRAFSKAPHVGDIIVSHESEKVTNLFKMMKAQIEIRKKKFADYGGDYNSFISMSEEKLPSIIIAINNFAAFMEIYEDKTEDILNLSREGIKYGIYFVLTATGVGTVRFRMLQNFKQLFTLQLNDESDYSSIVGKTYGLTPSNLPGRGLVRLDELYEFQIAQITFDDMPFKFIQEHCLKLRENWKGPYARKVPVLPENVDLSFISEYIQDGESLKIPIGVDKNSLAIYNYDFKTPYISLVLSMGNDHLEFVNSISQLIIEKYDIDITIFDISQSYFDTYKGKDIYFSNLNECQKAIDELFDIVLYRNNTLASAIENGQTVEEFEKKIVIINSVKELMGVLQGQTKEKLQLILEKGESKYNINIIIAESAKNISNINFDKWYKKHISQYDGIWVGSGILEQYQINISKSTSDMRSETTSDFGFVIKKGKATKIKLLNIKKEEK